MGGDVITDAEKNVSTMCPHLRVRLAYDNQKNRLPPEIFNAPKISETPFFVPSKVRGQPAPVNLTKKNLFIRGITWPAMLPHLRFVLMAMPYLRFKIVNDQRIKEVFVGAESFKSQPLSVRETESKEMNNAIGDLLGDAYDLVIIQLGLLGYKNVAAAGVLKEALMMRVTQNRPTWLFETSDRNITWQYSRDPEVEAYVTDNFEEFTPETDIFETETDLSGMTVETVGPSDVRPPSRQLELAVDDDTGITVDEGGEDEDNMFAGLPGMGDDSSKKKKTFKKKPFRGRS
jgi:hypothetical protein